MNQKILLTIYSVSVLILIFMTIETLYSYQYEEYFWLSAFIFIILSLLVAKHFKIIKFEEDINHENKNENNNEK